MPLTHTFCPFAAASASSYSCFVMQLLSGSLSAAVRRSQHLQLNLRGFTCASECPRWSLKWWQAGQRNGMVASGKRGAGQEGSSFDFFRNTSNFIITQEVQVGLEHHGLSSAAERPLSFTPCRRVSHSLL